MPWPHYVPLVWPRAPLSRASVKRVAICRRPWRRRKVGKHNATEKRAKYNSINQNTVYVVQRDMRLFFCSGEPFDPVPLLNNAVANIICQIMFGRRFDYSDNNFQSMLKNLTEMAYLEGSIWALVRCKSSSDTLNNLTWRHPFITWIKTNMLTSKFLIHVNRKV